MSRRYAFLDLVLLAILPIVLLAALDFFAVLDFLAAVDVLPALRSLAGAAGLWRRARKAVDDRVDFKPCRKAHTGARRPGSDAASFSAIRNFASA